MKPSQLLCSGPPADKSRDVSYTPDMPDDDKPVVEVTGDGFPVEVNVTVKGVTVRVLVTLPKLKPEPVRDSALRGPES